MKILVILTGGTIGSVNADGWIAPDSKNDFIIKKYRKKYNDTDTEFVIESPCTLLSENLSEKELNLILASVRENIDRDFDGIIITHGSDTLQYTSAAVSYGFCDAEIPVLLVCSAYTLNDERENGTANFAAAVEFVKAKLGGGVFVSYKNDNSDTVDIHTATRIIQHMEGSADIFSIDKEPYAFFKGTVKLNSGYVPSENSRSIKDVSYCRNPGILVIESRPKDGMRYSFDGVRAIIFKPYHSGTLNTSSEELLQFSQEARRLKIPMFLVNVKSGDRYESTRLFEDMGICVLPFCSFASVYVKCWLAVSAGADIKRFVTEPAAGEFLE